MLTVLDWLIIVILVGGLLRGFSVGAVRQVASLVGLVVAFLVSVEFMGMVGNMIVESLKLSESLAPLVGFTALFLGVYLLFLVISRFLEQVLASLSLSALDRVAGGAVGGFKAALLLSLLFLALTGIEVPSEKTKKKSTLYRPVAQLLPRTIEATEKWFPAAERAADELGTHVRAKIQSPPTPSSGKESAMSSPGS